MASIGVVSGSADHVQPALFDKHLEHTGREPSHCETKRVSPRLRSHFTHTGRVTLTFRLRQALQATMARCRLALLIRGESFLVEPNLCLDKPESTARVQPLIVVERAKGSSPFKNTARVRS